MERLAETMQSYDPSAPAAERIRVLDTIIPVLEHCITACESDRHLLVTDAWLSYARRSLAKSELGDAEGAAQDAEFASRFNRRHIENARKRGVRPEPDTEADSKDVLKVARDLDARILSRVVSQ